MKEDAELNRYVCPKCGAIEYCKHVYPKRTLKVMQEYHEPMCDGKPEFRFGQKGDSNDSE